MSIAHSQTVNTAGFGATGGTTGTMTTAASGSILLIFVTYGGTFTSVTDSKSNAWVQVDSTRQSGVSAQNTRVYMCENATGGASHTATLTGTSMGAGWSIFFTEITGGATSSSLDVAVGAAITAGNTIITPTLTASAGNRLILCYSGTTSGANPDNLSYNQSLVVPTNGRITNGTLGSGASGLGTLASSSFAAAITAAYSASTPPAGIIAFALKELVAAVQSRSLLAGVG